MYLRNILTFILKAIMLLLFCMLNPAFAFSQKLSVYDLRCNYANNPLGLEENPSISWKILSAQRNVLQTHYEIKVAEKQSDLKNNNALLWHSGKIKSEQSHQVAYKGKPLNSGVKYYWQVRVWDNKGNISPWSDVKFWQMGLLNPDDWKARWITATFDETPRASPLLRRNINLTKEIKNATAYITALGLYEACINGKKISDSYFTPGWTSYEKRLQYQAYDVTTMLNQGENILGATLADGWYNGDLSGKKDVYKRKAALLFQLEVEYKDGSKENFISDDQWICSLGPIRFSSIYHGEHYDSRLIKKDWNTVSYTIGNDWKKVALLQDANVHLVASVAPPVRKKETFKVKELIITPKGDTVLDFGQNLVGWIRIKASGKKGQQIKITHAEVLDKEGEFYTANLRKAKQELIFTLNGEREQEYEPTFTFQGFRYVKIQGYPGRLSPEAVDAAAFYTDMDITGKFSTSNTLINQLQSNIVWGQKGNFLDVPTDCPQRDERLGWTGDAQAFFNTASFNMDIRGFFEKWLADLKADQRSDGNVPVIIPNFRKPGKAGSAGWADAATIIPWHFYVAYADTSILRKQYGSMKLWVDFIATESTDYLWNKGKQHYGDWLFFSPTDDLFGRAAVTDKHLIAQTFYAHSVQNLIHAARVLQKTEDVKEYERLLKNIKKAFLEEYITGKGQLISGTQTAYILALNFDLFPEDMRAQAAERLVKNIKEYGHITTGFLGTPYICEVLSRFGYTNVAYELLLREKYPSWLYPVKMGATTIWERWDGIKPDGSFQNVAMNSFNHYAYGAVGDWMYKRIAGIKPDETFPGYKHVIIAPEPGGGLTSASAELETVYGKIKSAWQISGNLMRVEVIIPPNTEASLQLPFAPVDGIRESGKGFDYKKEGPVKLGSGNYVFTYSVKQ